MVPPIILVFRV